MSYILDALRRADAERQRGAVPGLHAPALTGVGNDGAATPGGPARRLGLAAAGLLLLGLAVAAGWLLRPGPAPTAAAVGQPGPALAVAPVAATPPAPVPASGLPPAAPAALPVPLPVPLPGPMLQAAPARRPAPGAASPTPAPTAAPTSAPAPAPTLAPTSAPTPAPTSAPTLAAERAVAPARLPSLAELPEAQKRDVGALVVGGAMHAEQAAMRIVILNGQVFHEGDKLSAELQVQQIGLKSVVMSHRGQRFELPF